MSEVDDMIGFPICKNIFFNNVTQRFDITFNSYELYLICKILRVEWEKQKNVFLTTSIDFATLFLAKT